MNDHIFKAFVVSEQPENVFKHGILWRKQSDLPDNEVYIKVFFSSLNYKDALSASGHKGITRKYPHTPGIDAAGIVAQSTSTRFLAGDKVIVTGYDLGMNTPGGFGGTISVPDKWVVPLPENLTLKECMMLGTAGLSAAQAVYKLLQAGQKPSDGPILVTGASGGVGSIAIAVLVKAGFQVIASTGKTGAADFLYEIGAVKVIDRAETVDTSSKVLLPWQWAGAIDTVGGVALGTVIKATKPNGNVALIGNVGGHIINTTLFPFILNGINLLGINSATCDYDTRTLLWQKLANEWKPAVLDMIAKPCRIEELSENISLILGGNITGRKYIVVD